MKILAITPMESGIREWLGTMAAAELATREARYPDRIAKGLIGVESAEADIGAWRAIATLFAHDSVETGLSWSDLIHAVRKQFDTLARPTGGAMPTDPVKAERLGAVDAILDRLEWQLKCVMARPSEQGREAA